MLPRSSGLLLHPTSLPGGRLGPAAHAFVDFCAAAGQRWWQVLPIGPPGAHRSPYASLSAFAGNEALIHADTEKEAALDAPWLADYALFRALKDAHNGAPWIAWPRGLRERDPDALRKAREKHAVAVERHARRQRVFQHQWKELRRYANRHGVGLIGDLPLFVAHDSADVWAHRDLFKLQRSGRPTVVAGVPPDYFSTDGQLWGNPVYRWDIVRRRRFRWWIARLERMFELFDMVRLDHFLGYVRTWEVSARAKTARRGKWAKGPGASFFHAVGRGPFIAEDLGLVTPEAISLRKRFDLPGMQVLQFCFEENGTRPHDFEPQTVVYTGTHDNDTTAGWFRKGGVGPERARRYAGCRADHIAWGLLRVGHLSPAALAIAPVQDLLGLGSRARMNTPGTTRGNWGWRLKRGMLTRALSRRLFELTETAGR